MPLLVIDVLFFFSSSSADRTANGSLKVKAKWFHMACLALKSFPVWKNHRLKKINKNSFKRDEIFNITNPICSLFAPSAYTNITHAGWAPGEDTDTHVPHF